MKTISRSTIALLTFSLGLLAVAGWSAQIGRRVWSPRVFAWRNFFKPQPEIEEQANCPLHLVYPRFYSFTTIGYAIGNVLTLEAKNVSRKPIHSFTVSYYSPEPTDTGSGGWQPEKILQPGQSETIKLSSQGNDRVFISVDFVQFADGDVWYADPPKNTVKPEGVEAGAKAARQYLKEILDSNGAAAVMAALPLIRLHVDSPEFSSNGVYGFFGYYCGVTRTVVSVERAYQEDGLPGVEKFLTEFTYR